MNFGYSFTFQSLDKGLIERIGPTGFTVSIFNMSSNFLSLSSGIIYQLAFIIVVSVILFFSFYTFALFGFQHSYAATFQSLIFAYFILVIFAYFDE